MPSTMPMRSLCLDAVTSCTLRCTPLGRVNGSRLHTQDPSTAITCLSTASLVSERAIGRELLRASVLFDGVAELVALSQWARPLGSIAGWGARGGERDREGRSEVRGQPPGRRPLRHHHREDAHWVVYERAV